MPRRSLSSAAPPAPPVSWYVDFSKPFGVFSSFRSGTDVAAAPACAQVFSHVVLYYFYYCLVLNGGNVLLPTSWAELSAAVQQTAAATAPTWTAAALYFGYLALQLLFAFVMPGLEMVGRPDDTGRSLKYLCNGFASWWATQALLVALHFSGLVRLSAVIDNLGPLITTGVLFGDLVALFCYAFAHASGQTTRLTGNHVYDFFMGAILHPRIGVVDIKMLAVSD